MKTNVSLEECFLSYVKTGHFLLSLYRITYRIIGNNKCHIVMKIFQFLYIIGEAVSCEVNKN